MTPDLSRSNCSRAPTVARFAAGAFRNLPSASLSATRLPLTKLILAPRGTGEKRQRKTGHEIRFICTCFVEFCDLARSGCLMLPEAIE